jgi:hypothetical protein
MFQHEILYHKNGIIEYYLTFTSYKSKRTLIQKQIDKIELMELLRTFIFLKRHNSVHVIKGNLLSGGSWYEVRIFS